MQGPRVCMSMWLTLVSVGQLLRLICFRIINFAFVHLQLSYVMLENHSILGPAIMPNSFACAQYSLVDIKCVCDSHRRCTSRFQSSSRSRVRPIHHFDLNKLITIFLHEYFCSFSAAGAKSALLSESLLYGDELKEQTKFE